MSITGHSRVSNNGRPTLSACMIVKNEEYFLPQCLKSIKDAVDEIIIVDTGSTDKTVDIAQSFGARVHHHPWKNNFSEARNHSLDYATGDWILQIDADEALEQADIPLLHKLITADSYNVIFVAIYSELPGGQAKHYFQRIFRRGKAHFEGIVHNQLIFEGKALQSKIRLYHYGYNLSEFEMQKKYKRTGDLLRQQLAENPNNIFVMANLIRNYRNEYNFEKVIELGEKGLNISISQTDLVSKIQRQRISIDLTHALLNTNQVDRAEEVCKKALEENPDSFDVLLVLGEILLKKRAFSNALNYFKKYLVLKEKENKDPSFKVLSADFYYYEHGAYNNIGECYKHLGLICEAEIAYKKAIELNNKEPLYYSNLAQLYISQNRFEEAENIADTAVKRGIANHLTYLLLGKAYSSRRRYNDAINAFRQSIHIDSKNVSAHIYFINLLIQTNQFTQAEKTLKEIIPSYPDNLRLKCLSEKIKYKQGNRESATQFIQNILKSNIIDSDIYLDLGDLCMDMELYTTAIELWERYFNIFPADATVVANIATCYARLGKLESAKFGFQAALKIDPGCNYAIQNLAALSKLENKGYVNIGNDA
ncbi:MAG: tetratricopeptide repeat protein [Candidatus Brocadia sp.]|nr:tetratricopeptide repeat protein [Candidatus Brocadia sp.]